MDYHKMENITTLTCPSEDEGLGVAAEGMAVRGFSFCFFSVLFGGRGIIGASSDKIGSQTSLSPSFQSSWSSPSLRVEDPSPRRNYIQNITTPATRMKIVRNFNETYK
jgi:hypothetical protein